MTWTVDDSGSQTAVIGIEHALNTKFGEGTYSFAVNTVNLALGDTVELRVYDIAQGKAVWKAAYQHAQISPGKCTPPITVVSGAMFTLKQTAGTGRVFPWVARRTGGTIASTGLRTNLTGFWPLDTTSWLDATGNGSTLTGTASPTIVAGVVDGAVSLNGSTQYLSVASNTNIAAGGGSFSAQVWFNCPSNPNVGSSILFNKRNNAFLQDEWGFGSIFTTGNFWSFTCWDNAANTLFVAGSAISTGWHQSIGTYDAPTKTMTFYVDGTSYGTTTLVNPLNSFAAPLGFGSIANGAAIISQLTLLQRCGFWKGRVLSAGDVTLLYNGGLGRNYAQMA